MNHCVMFGQRIKGHAMIVRDPEKNFEAVEDI